MATSIQIATTTIGGPALRLRSLFAMLALASSGGEALLASPQHKTADLSGGALA